MCLVATQGEKVRGRAGTPFQHARAKRISSARRARRGLPAPPPGSPKERRCRKRLLDGDRRSLTGAPLTASSEARQMGAPRPSLQRVGSTDEEDQSAGYVRIAFGRVK